MNDHARGESFVLALLRCPVCSSRMRFDGDSCRCENQHKYPCIDGCIPVFVDYAKHSDVYTKQVEYFSRESQTGRKRHKLDPWMRKFVTIADEQFGEEGHDRIVLDVGCGSGYMSIELAMRGYRVIGTDLTSSAVRALAHKANALGLEERIAPLACSALDLPFAKACIDVVVVNAVIERLPDDASFLAQVSRTGSACQGMIVAPIAYKYIWPFLWLPNWIHDRRIGHLRRYDYESLEKLLKQYGFAIVRTHYSGHLLKMMGTAAQCLFGKHNLDCQLERHDARHAARAYGSSNITVAFRRTGENSTQAQFGTRQ